MSATVFDALRTGDRKLATALLTDGKVDIRARGPSRMNLLEQFIHWREVVPESDEGAEWAKLIFGAYKRQNRLYETYAWWVRDRIAGTFYAGKLSANVLEFVMFQQEFGMVDLLRGAAFGMSMSAVSPARSVARDSPFTFAVRYSRDSFVFFMARKGGILSKDAKEYVPLLERIIEYDNDVVLEELLFDKNYGVAYYKWLLNGTAAWELATRHRAARCTAVIADAMIQRKDRKETAPVPDFAKEAVESFAVRKVDSMPEAQHNLAYEEMEAANDASMRYIVNSEDIPF